MGWTAEDEPSPLEPTGNRPADRAAHGLGAPPLGELAVLEGLDPFDLHGGQAADGAPGGGAGPSPQESFGRREPVADAVTQQSFESHRYVAEAAAAAEAKLLAAAAAAAAEAGEGGVGELLSLELHSLAARQVQGARFGAAELTTASSPPGLPRLSVALHT